MTRKELRERILYRLNEDVTSPVHATVAQVNTTIQEGLEVLAEEVSELRRQTFITIEQGRFLYTLGEVASDVMGIMQIWNEPESEALEVITMRELDNHRNEWMDVKGPPDWWFPVAWDCFGIHPAPIIGGGILRIDYVAWPTVLQSDNDSPVLNDDEQDLAIMYGFYDGLIRQWEVDRGRDIFNTFVQAWRDETFKTRTRRFQHIEANRQISPTSFPEA